MDKDLGFVGNQYNTMLSIFYVPYVVFAPPIGMLGKKYGPHRVLPILMFCFGSATLLAASVKNWSGMMALRWFLGMFDSSRRLVESVRLTVHRHVGVCFLSVGHLLLDYLLPKR
jgi:MFS family permease